MGVIARAMASEPAAELSCRRAWPGGMSWYSAWLFRELELLPAKLQELIPGETFTERSSSIMAMSSVIEQFTHDNKCSSIDEIVERLVELQYLRQAGSGNHTLYRALVFTVLGWSSMVYKPAPSACPPEELAIYHDHDHPDSGLVFEVYKVSADLSDRPLHILLKAFGNLIPARSTNATQDATEATHAAMSWTALCPEDMNAHLLSVLLRVRFRWVDSLALHLDYDKSTRTLSLFSFPSLCVEMLRSGGIIFAFASHDGNSVDRRADENDIATLLREVLLSYRLLFGQSSKARSLFKHLAAKGELPFPRQDDLLSLLCTSKNPGLVERSLPEDRAVYFMPRDFSVLCERVKLIAKELDEVQPKSMRDLVRDSRDKLQYWTFWLVCIIGGISMLLSLIQAVLQAVQIAQTSQPTG